MDEYEPWIFVPPEALMEFQRQKNAHMSAVVRALAHPSYTHRRDPGADHSDLFRRCLRQIQLSAPDERPTVVDADGDGLASIRHPQLGSEREGAMSGSQA